MAEIDWSEVYNNPFWVAVGILFVGLFLRSCFQRDDRDDD